MGGLKTKLGVIVTTVIVGCAVAMPALAGERGETVSSRTAAHTAMNDVVHEVLIEAGLSPGKLSGDRKDRVANGLTRLVEAGIIDSTSVGEIQELARSGELGQVMSERAKVAAAARRAENGRPDNPGNSGSVPGGGADRGESGDPGSKGKGQGQGGGDTDG